MRRKDVFENGQDTLILSYLPKMDSVKLIIPSEFIDYSKGTVDLEKVALWLYNTESNQDVKIEYETR